MKFEEIRSDLIKERRELLPKLKDLEKRFYDAKSSFGMGNNEEICSCNDELLNIIVELSEFIDKYRNEFDKFISAYDLKDIAKPGIIKRFYKVLYRIFLPVNYESKNQFLYNEIWKFIQNHDVNNNLRYVFSYDCHDFSRYQGTTSDLTFYKEYPPDNKMYAIERWDQFEEDLNNFVVK